MRIALGIEYDGTAYNGWQRQKTGLGVQQRVEEALQTVANHDIEVICAGRTDTGVHAAGQVVHFDTDSQRDDRGWLLGANSNMPDDISVIWAQHVADDFHARFHATGRNYRYRILNRLQRSALHRHRAWWVYAPLDAEKMNIAAQHLLGEHDFSSFRAVACQAKNPVRTVYQLDVQRRVLFLHEPPRTAFRPSVAASSRPSDARYGYGRSVECVHSATLPYTSHR